MTQQSATTISILGSGWLGLPLIEHFRALGYAVKASTRSAARVDEIERAGAGAFIVDIDNLDDTVDEFLRTDILVINIPSINLEGFRRLLAAVQQSAIGKVLFVSSTSVYRNLDKTVTESSGDESPGSPLLAIENLFRGAGFECTIVRFGGLIGGRRHPGRFFAHGKTVPNPDAPVNLIHRDDCIAIIGRIVERGAWGEIFNACADTHPSKREFYRRAAQSLGIDDLRFDDTDSRGGKTVGNEKLKRELDYELRHPDLMRIDFG